MKKRWLICFVMVLAVCLTLLSACTKVEFDNETLYELLSNLQQKMLAMSETPESFTLDRVIKNYDKNGDETNVYVVWEIEDTDLITLNEESDNVTVVIPDERETDINYKLRATFTDKDGSPYTDDGEKFTAVFKLVAPKTGSTNPGGEAEPDNDEPGGGTTPGGDVGGDEQSEWKDYVGKTYELFDIFGANDSVTVEIQSAAIVITHDGTPAIITEIEFYPADEEYEYDEFEFEWQKTTCYLDIYDDGYVELCDYDYYIDYVLEEYVDEYGTPSDDWSEHVGSYTLYVYDENTKQIDFNDAVVVQITDEKIIITKGDIVTEITEIEYYIDAVFQSYISDDFYFTWNDEECILSIYQDDGSVELYGDTFTYVGDSEGGGGDVGGDVGGEIVPGSTIKIEFSEQKFSNEQEIKSFTAGGLTFTFTDGFTPTKWFDNKTAIRVYGGGLMTVAGAKMVKIELILSSGGDSNTITTNVGKFSDKAWTGSADSVTFSIGGTSGHRRIAGVNVTFEGSSEQGGGETNPDVGAEVPEGATLYDFVQNFDVYAADWSTEGTIYGEHKVTSAQLGISSTVEFLFSRASKQGGDNPIIDRPVMASKNDDQYLTVSVKGQTISAVTFNLKEWVPGGNLNIYKTFTKVQIEYRIGDGAWTVVSDVGFSGEAQRITDYQTLSSGALPDGVTSVRLVVNGGNDSSNQQVGVSSVALTLA